jgi:hypothetical protein
MAFIYGSMITFLRVNAHLLFIQSVDMFILCLLRYKISKLTSSDSLVVAIRLKRNVYFALLQNFYITLLQTKYLDGNRTIIKKILAHKVSLSYFM